MQNRDKLSSSTGCFGVKIADDLGSAVGIPAVGHRSTEEKFTAISELKSGQRSTEAKFTAISALKSGQKPTEAKITAISALKLGQRSTEVKFTAISALKPGQKQSQLCSVDNCPLVEFHVIGLYIGDSPASRLACV